MWIEEYLNFQYYDYVGIIGDFLILILFLLNQFGKLKNNNFYYDFGNFIGSVPLVF